MASCARYGCKRPECREAERRAKRENERDARNGRPVVVPAVAAAEHLRLLVSSGMPVIDIGERSGVSATQIRGILHGRIDRTYRVTEEAILGVSIPEGDWTPTADGFANITGTRRRLQALSVQGFPLSFLAMRMDTGRTAVRGLRSGPQMQVRVSTLRKVVRLHDELWDADPFDLGLSPSPVHRAQKWAEKQGWLPTEAWSDIDDPECVPTLDTPRHVALAEDAEELMRTQGYSRGDAAARLGVSKKYLEKVLSRRRKTLVEA